MGISCGMLFYLPSIIPGCCGDDPLHLPAQSSVRHPELRHPLARGYKRPDPAGSEWTALASGPQLGSAFFHTPIAVGFRRRHADLPIGSARSSDAVIRGRDDRRRRPAATVLSCDVADDFAGRSVYFHHRCDRFLSGLHTGVGGQWRYGRAIVCFDVLCALFIRQRIPPLPLRCGCRSSLAALHSYPDPDRHLPLGLKKFVYYETEEGGKF